jgi:Short C-terminal domain
MIGRRGVGGRRGRGVVRGVARTAVVAGTATAASYAVSGQIEKHRANQEQEQMEQQGAYSPPPDQAQYAPSDAPADAGNDGDDVASQLQQLAELRQQGLLTDEEFAAAKGKLLAS